MKVGDYVRTKYGNIGKIIEQNDYNVVINSKNNMELFISKEDNIKSSSNIIDLIEEHDLLKLYDRDYGEEYIAEVILEDKNMLCVHNYECSDLLILEYEFITNEHIKLKSIVTKEQFESMEYKVGE